MWDIIRKTVTRTKYIDYVNYDTESDCDINIGLNKKYPPCTNTLHTD